MAVYTEVSDEDLATFVASYGLGALLSYKGIAEGVENTNYLVHTDKGPFFLTLFEKRVAPTDLPFFLGLMEHLAKAGLTCPTPVRDGEGRMLRTLAGRPAALVTFLEGVWIRRPLPRHCLAVGEALARLHLAGRGFGLQRANALGAFRLAPALRALSSASGRGGGGARSHHRAGARPPGSALAGRPGAGHHPRRPLSRQRVLPRRQALGPHRFLLRLQRRARLRHRRHPQRVVLRERSFLQSDQGPGAAERLPERAHA